MKKDNLIVNHAGVEHEYGAECDECERIYLESPVVQRLLSKRNKIVAMHICELIDDIESDHPIDTSLDEWKMFKRIRNTIRDRYLKK